MQNSNNENAEVIAVTKDCEIRGQIIKREGYRGRFSDIINEDKRFINMTNAEIVFSDASKAKKHLDFLCLNKDSIIMFYPSEKQ